MNAMFITLLAIVGLFYVAGGSFDDKMRAIRARNPEGNRLDAEDVTPITNTEIAAQGTPEYMARLKRQGDTLLPDGRMEHTTYPAPDPSSSYRDLYS